MVLLVGLILDFGDFNMFSSVCAVPINCSFVPFSHYCREDKDKDKDKDDRTQAHVRTTSKALSAVIIRDAACLSGSLLSLLSLTFCFSDLRAHSP
jgi:hypothetical protein